MALLKFWGYDNPRTQNHGACMYYPIAIDLPESEAETYGVRFPDAPGCISAGNSIQNAVQNAKTALQSHFELLALEGITPTLATEIQSHRDDPEYEGCIWGVVDIDLEPFMGGSEKKNVSLPRLLILQIDNALNDHPEYKSNRSYFLQIAAMRELSRLNDD